MINNIFKYCLTTIILFIVISCTKTSKNDISLNTIQNESEAIINLEEKDTTKNTVYLETLNENTINNDNINNDNINDEEIIIEDFFLIQNNINANIFPNDFIIGQIQNTIKINYEISSIYKVIFDFNNSLIDKLYNEDLIYDLKKEFIISSISSYINSTNQIESFRIGVITVDSTSIGKAKVRFFSDYGSINGHIYLIKSNNNWNISDLQYNFMDFTSKSNNKYTPSYYNIDIYGINP